jgi:HEAT repeats
MTGSAGRSVEWARNRLTDIDPRARANAVEALWGHDTAYVRDLLRSAARDSNNRVAGNALFALYSFGESSTMQDLLKMASSKVPRRRASAAWAIGQTGDRRFADALGLLTGDANATVRKRAFSALERVRKAAADMRTGTEWRVSARILPSHDGVREIALEAEPLDGSLLPKLVATQFVLTENGQVVYNYRLEERAAREVLAVSFIFPHTETSTSGPPAWVAGALGSLPSKRSTDLWRAVYFVEGENDVASPREPPPLTSKAEAVAAAFQRQPGKAECRDFWNSIRDCARAKRAPGWRPQLIVYCPVDPGVPADASEIVSLATQSKAIVQVIASASNTALEDLCRITHGSFRIAAPGDDASVLVQESYRTLSARFLITYEPVVPNADSLHIWVSNSTGWGETTIAF